MEVRFVDYSEQTINEALSGGDWELMTVIPVMKELSYESFRGRRVMTHRCVLGPINKSGSRQKAKVVKANEDEINQALQEGWQIFEFLPDYHVVDGDSEFDRYNSKISVRTLCILTRWEDVI